MDGKEKLQKVLINTILIMAKYYIRLHKDTIMKTTIFFFLFVMNFGYIINP